MRFLLALLLPAIALAQPIPNNCTNPSAACQSKKFKLLAGNTLCFNSTTCTDTISASTTTAGMLFNSGVSNSGTNAAYNFDTTNALSGTTLLLNLANQGVSEFTVSQGGTLNVAGGATFNGFVLVNAGASAQNFQSSLFWSTSSSVPPSFAGFVSDGSTAIGARIGSYNTFSTAGSKLVAFSNTLGGTASDIAGVSLGGAYIAPYTDISGTPGSGTANTPTGLVAFASASSATITITDSVSKTTSICVATLQTIDATAKSAACVPGNGSFTLTPNAATTGTTKVQFVLFNGN